MPGRFHEDGRAKGRNLVALVFLVSLFIVGRKVTSQEASIIQLKNPLKGIGQNAVVSVEVRDAHYGLKRIELEVLQDGRTVHRVGMSTSSPRGPWWKSWSSHGETVTAWNAPVGRKVIPDLHEGRATLHFTAINDSWGRFFRGGRSDFWLNVSVRFFPPQVQVLSSHNEVSQGSAGLIVFEVSTGTTESGIQVGNDFFPSWPLRNSLPETRLCLFAFPYDADPKTPVRIVARDDAGNETVTRLDCRVFRSNFRSDTIELSDEFLDRVVPPILSQTPELRDQGSLLKNFLLVNGTLRLMNAHELVAIAQRSAPRCLWDQPFLRPGHSKVEASFADRRTYVYNGQPVDHQTHLGFDFAATEHTPVMAANDGVVAFAGSLGIYGNAIVLDHGCGLATLYGHLSTVGVREGETVDRGRIIGRTGQTGLAGGDHLHFSVLVGGIPVNPVDWWNARWMRDRIESKLAASPSRMAAPH